MNSVRELIQDAEQLARHAATTPAHAEEVAATALALAALSDKIQKALDPLKDKLRAEVCSTWDGKDLPFSYDFELPQGKVSITIPKKTVKLSKSTDIDGLQAMLGDQFAVYFETVVSHKPRRNFPDLIQARVASDGVRDLLLKSIDQKDSTPRVSFKPT
tara:strand:- start:54 stop:530 length:477 start_codon:yes stop_codon:yes gene_type:complete